ncbi:MAG: hypothetical protein LBF41_02350 [Deltaproteobacteria bacterium]|jgi:hypothetical protein|nr:hypothetical protein [Deltaproteobacteria bacterium]
MSPSRKKERDGSRSARGRTSLIVVSVTVAIVIAAAVAIFAGTGTARGPESPDPPELRRVEPVSEDDFKQWPDIVVATRDFPGGRDYLRALNSGLAIEGFAIPRNGEESFVASGAQSGYDDDTLRVAAEGDARVGEKTLSLLGGASFEKADPVAGSASNNLLWIRGADIGPGPLGGSFPDEAEGAAIGGYSLNFSSTDNKVLIDRGGTVGGRAVGGASGAASTGAADGSPKIEVRGNVVEIRWGQVNEAVGGASAPANDDDCDPSAPCGAEVTGNRVLAMMRDHIDDVGIHGFLAGGLSDSGNVSKNEVFIEGGTFFENGDVAPGIRGGHSGGGKGRKGVTVKDNYVQIHWEWNDVFGGRVGEVVGGSIGETEGGFITGNEVVILNPGFEYAGEGIDAVYGGLLREPAYPDNFAEISGNVVSIRADDRDGVYSRISRVRGGAMRESMTADGESLGKVADNRVTVWGLVKGIDVVAGLVEGTFGATPVTGNRAIVGGGAMFEELIAGAANHDVWDASGGAALFSDNSVEIRGVNPDVRRTDLLVAGASITGEAKAENNSVSFSGGVNKVDAVAGAVLEDRASAGDKNRVTFADGENAVFGDVFGVMTRGGGEGAIGRDNGVTFAGGNTTVAGSVYGVGGGSGGVGSGTSVSFVGGTSTVAGSVYGVGGGSGGVGSGTSVSFVGGISTVKGDLVLVDSRDFEGPLGNGSFVSFAGGENSIGGNVRAEAGHLLIYGGRNFLGTSSSGDATGIGAGNIMIFGGRDNFFRGRTMASGNLVVSGGAENTFFGPADVSGNLEIKGGAENWFRDLASAANLTLRGGGRNFFSLGLAVTGKVAVTGGENVMGPVSAAELEIAGGDSTFDYDAPTVLAKRAAFRKGTVRGGFFETPNLTLSEEGSVLTFAVSPARLGSNPLLKVTGGDLSVSGNVRIDLDFLENATFDAIDAPGSEIPLDKFLPITVNGLSMEGSTRQSATFSLEAGKLKIATSSAASQSLAWSETPAVPGTWDLTSANFKGSESVFAFFDEAVFDDSGLVGAIDLPDGILVSDMTVSADYVFSGGSLRGIGKAIGDGLSPGGALTVRGGAVVTFDNSLVDFENGVDIGDGSKASFSASLGEHMSYLIEDGSVLELKGDGDWVFKGVADNGGAIVKEGAGTLTVGSPFTRGDLFLNSGTLVLESISGWGGTVLAKSGSVLKALRHSTIGEGIFAEGAIVEGESLYVLGSLSLDGVTLRVDPADLLSDVFLFVQGDLYLTGPVRVDLKTFLPGEYRILDYRGDNRIGKPLFETPTVSGKPLTARQRATWRFSPGSITLVLEDAPS